MVEGDVSDMTETLRSYDSEAYVSTQEEDEDEEIEITAIIYLRCQSSQP